MQLPVDVGEAATEACLDHGQGRPTLALAGSESLPERGLGRLRDRGWHRAIFADPAQWCTRSLPPGWCGDQLGRWEERAGWEVAAVGVARFRSCSGRRSAGG